MSEIRSGARRRLGVTLSALVFGAYLMLTVVPAQAATDGNATCTYNAVNRQVTVSSTGGSDLSIVVGTGGAILFDDDLDASDGTACDTATVNNTDGITAEPDEDLEVDISGGPFAPGETPEASGTSEIEIDIDGSVNAMEDVEVEGSSGDDNIVAGNGLAAPTGSIVFAGAINLNGDNDADVTFNDNADASEDVKIRGNDGNDTVSFNGGAGTGAFLEQDAPDAEGGDGNDSLTGSDFDTGFGDQLHGGEGNDSLSGLGGQDFLNDDGLVDFGDGFTCATDENDILDGGDGIDELFSGDGRDLLIGGDGNDDESGGSCADTFDEGTGPNGRDNFHGNGGEAGGPFECDLEGTGNLFDDLVDYSQRNSELLLVLNGGFESGEVGASEDDRIGGGIDSALGGTADDEIHGSFDENFLGGGPGNDTIDAGHNDDCVQGGPGDDDLTGGGQHDMVDYSDSAAGVTVNLTDGTATGNGTDTLDGFVDVNGSESGDNITGDAEENDLFGNGGNDNIDGLDNDDFSDGGEGNDSVVDTGDSTEEEDHLLGGLGDDSVNGGIDDDDLDGDNDEDDLTGQGNDSVEGGEGFDQIDGEGGNDTLTDSGTVADDNDDNFQGGDGSDTMTDTTVGDDDFNGDSGFNGETGDGNDVVNSGDGDDEGDLDGGNDTITDTGAVDPSDTSCNDSYFGDTGDDVIHLGPGVDGAGGGDGDDSIFGEDGDDVCDFRSEERRV